MNIVYCTLQECNQLLEWFDLADKIPSDDTYTLYTVNAYCEYLIKFIKRTLYTVHYASYFTV